MVHIFFDSLIFFLSSLLFFLSSFVFILYSLFFVLFSQPKKLHLHLSLASINNDIYRT